MQISQNSRDAARFMLEKLFQRPTDARVQTRQEAPSNRQIPPGVEVQVYDQAWGAMIHPLIIAYSAPEGVEDPLKTYNDLRASYARNRFEDLVSGNSAGDSVEVRPWETSTQGFIQHLDSDGDGKASLADFQQACSRLGQSDDIASVFARADADGDGAIDELEFFQAGRPHTEVIPMETALEGADLNGDAGLSQNEVSFFSGQPNDEAMAARFKEIDADSDGKLDADELQAAWTSYQARSMDAYDAYMHRIEVFAAAVKNLNEDVNALRQTGDPNPLSVRFGEMDSNSDGTLDEQELQSALKFYQARAMDAYAEQANRVDARAATTPETIDSVDA